MTTAYTNLLGLALPVTGELESSWGDVVNDSITALLDDAVAGTTTLSTDADVTLTTTDGASNQARAAVLLWTASGSTTRNITAPAQSKAYIVINATGGSQSIVIRGAGPTTGVTVAAGKKTLVAWNGSDFVSIASTSIALGSDVTGTLPVANGGTGATSFTAGRLLLGNGTSALQVLSAGTSGYVLTTDGTNVGWTAPTVGGSVTSVSFSGGTTGLSASGGPIVTSGTFTLSGTLNVANGGTGAVSLSANAVLLGNGTAAVQAVSPGTSGNVLTSNGTTWASVAPAYTGTVTSVSFSTGTTGLTVSGSPVTSSGTITLGGTLNVANGGTGAASLSANAVLLGNGTGAIQAVAPSTAGNVLTSNGSTWASTAPGATAHTRRTVTANDTVVAADKGNLVDVTANSPTLSFTAAATLGSAFWCELRNSGTGDVTLDPNGSETIDGLTSFVMYPGEHRRVFCTGTAFVSLVLRPFYRAWTSSGTHIDPPGYRLIEGLVWGGGAGGGKAGSGSFVTGGGGGGACVPLWRAVTTPGTSVTVTIGSATSNQTSVGNGAAGNPSSFGSVTAYGGGAGYGNGSASGTGGGGGGGLSAGSAGVSGTSPGAGGEPGTEGAGSGYDADGLGGAMAGGNSAYGGAGGGGNQSIEAVGGRSVYGGGGGGRGAGSSTAGGTSLFGGTGGAGSQSGNGTDGTAPGGGGGGTQTGAQAGAGARGEARVWGVV